MTPKEKAKELFDKLILYTRVYHEVFGWENDGDSTKQCALIAVDEILDEVSSLIKIKYWQEVKQEIEKL